MVIVSVHSKSNNPSKKFGLTRQASEIVNGLRLHSRVVLSVFANPYGLSGFEGIENIEGLVMAYEDNEIAQNLSAQLIFGGISAKGKLPVTVSPYFQMGTGIATESPIRLKYTIPEEVGLDAKDLAKIDSIAFNAIKERATPGCQVVVAKEGKVIYQKSFGYHTYENKIPVKNTDLYDLASITKIASTLITLMKLQDEQKFGIDSTLGYYLTHLDTTNPSAPLGTGKDSIIIRELLAHQAQLRSWIPFWMKTVSGIKFDKRIKQFVTENHRLLENIYQKKPSDEFPVRVAENCIYTRATRIQ